MGEKQPEKQSLGRRIGRVVATLAIWLVLAVVAALIVAVIPNVRTCVQNGASGCWESVKNGVRIERAQPAATADAQPAGTNAQSTGIRMSSAWLNVMDWVILVISLIVAVRIMYPPEDLTTASNSGS